jgi:hypothetical protein
LPILLPANPLTINDVADVAVLPIFQTSIYQYDPSGDF